MEDSIEKDLDDLFEFLGLYINNLDTLRTRFIKSPEYQPHLCKIIYADIRITRVDPEQVEDYHYEADFKKYISDEILMIGVDGIKAFKSVIDSFYKDNERYELVTKYHNELNWFREYFSNKEDLNINSTLSSIISLFEKEFNYIINNYMPNLPGINKIHFNLSQNEIAALLIILTEAKVLSFKEDHVFSGKTNYQNIYSIAGFANKLYTYRRDKAQNPCKTMDNQIRRMQSNTS